MPVPQEGGETAASKADMRPVVREADIRHVWRNNKIIRNDSRFFQFGNDIELAP